VEVKILNPGREGGFPCLSHQGSWRRIKRFSDFRANSCNAETVVAWPLAQFSSCADPTDADMVILFGYSRFWGVSHGCCIRVYFGNFAKLNPLRTVGVVRLVGCVTVGAANRGVSAGWALLANRERAWMLLSLVGVCADRTARVVPAQSRWVAVDLALAALGAPSIRNVIIQFALMVTDNEVLTANAGFLDVACQRHDQSGVCLLLSSLSWGEPPGGLPLDKLRVVGGKTLRDFR